MRRAVGIEGRLPLGHLSRSLTVRQAFTWCRYSELMKSDAAALLIESVTSAHLRRLKKLIRGIHIICRDCLMKSKCVEYNNHWHDLAYDIAIWRGRISTRGATLT